MLMCALLIAVPVTTESASAAVATNRTAKAKISGWVTVQNGQKKYYKKGQYLKGCKKIEKNYYYFGPKGVMKTQDITSHGVTYFIERNGHVLGRRKGSRYMAPDGRKLNKKAGRKLTPANRGMHSKCDFLESGISYSRFRLEINNI